MFLFQAPAYINDDSTADGAPGDFSAPDIKDWVAETANYTTGKEGEAPVGSC